MQELLTNKTIEKLKYDLVREGLIDYDDLMGAEEVSKQSEANLAQVLIKQNFITENQLLSFIENKLHIPFINLDDYSLDQSCIDYIPYEDAKKYRIIPLFKIEDVLTIAMADPMDLFLLKNLISSINCKIEPVICSERSILKAIDEYYVPDELPKKVCVEEVHFAWEDELRQDMHDEFKAQRIIESILCQGLIENTQEIVFEYAFNGLTVRFKTDGNIYDKGVIPVLLVPLCLARLKLMSGLNPSVVEIPQLGRLKLSVDSLKLNNPIIAKVADKVAFHETICTAGVSIFPTTKGERISIKIYRPPLPLEKLDITDNQLDPLKSMLQSSGLIVITGEDYDKTGSFAYSIVSSLIDLNKSILTVESVIKYEIPEINQCEINEKVGFSIETALNHIEFQSSDVIYIESVFTKEGFNFLSSLASTGKLVITNIAGFDKTKFQKFASENLSVIDCRVISLKNKKVELIK